MTVGQRIEYLRKQNGMTQYELAGKVGVQAAAISKYEKDIVTNLKQDMIGKLSNALGVAPSYLLGYTDEPISETCGIRLDDSNTSKYIKNIVDVCLTMNEAQLKAVYNMLTAMNGGAGKE